MSYALNLSEDNRILSVCVVLPIGYVDEEGKPTNEEKGIPVYNIVDGEYNGMPVVETFPDDFPDYLYVDGKYVYDPLPEPEPIEPTGEEVTTDDMAAAIMEGVNAV